MRARPHAAPAPTVGGTALIAWTVYGFSIALVLIGLLLLALSWSVDVPPGWGFRGFPAIFAVVYGSVGLLIAIRQPRNPIGWDAFADRLRDEVDLNALRTDLLGAVGETMAPAHAGLWLRERS